MSDIKNGGPAFPAPEAVFDVAVAQMRGVQRLGSLQGMSLRDYFAAAAMQGLVVRIGKHDTDLIAHDAYVMADAMLAARDK